MIVLDIGLVIGSVILAIWASWSALDLIRSDAADAAGNDFFLLLIYCVFLSFEGEQEIWSMRPFLVSMTMFLVLWLVCLGMILEYRAAQVRKPQPLDAYLTEKELRRKYRRRVVVPKIAMVATILGFVGQIFESWPVLGPWVVLPIAGILGSLMAVLALRYRVWRGEKISNPVT